MVATGTLLLGATAVFFVAMIGVGYKTEQWVGHNEDFLVAGREVTWLVTGLGVAAIVWAGDFFALFSIFAVVFGFWAAAVPVASLGVGYLMYGTLFSPVVRAVGSYTIGELLEIRFDTKTRLLVTLYLGIAMAIFLPAGSLGVASMLNGFVGWPIIPAATGMIALVGIIVLSGGLWGVTVTDIIEAVIGYLTLPIVLIWLYANFGGANYLMTNIPDVFTFPGEFGLGIGPNSYITWALLWGIFLLYGSPYYWIRAVAARSDKAAKRGFQFAGVLGIVLAFFMGLLPLYGLAFDPSTFAPFGGSVPPAGALGVLSQNIPAAMGVFFMVTIIAANISTYTTTSMGGIASFSRDIYQRLVNPDADAYEMLNPTRIISVLFIIGGWALVFVGNIQFLLGILLTYLGISTIITLAGIYSKRVTSDAAFLAALGGGIVALVWPVFEIDPTIHQIFPTAGIVIVALVAVTLFTAPKYYGRSEWSPSATDGGSPVDLTDEELTVLVFISAGANRFSDLLDALGVDGTQVNDIVEGLEQNGYLTRKGYTGASLFMFEVTQQGREAVESSSHDLVNANGTRITKQSQEILTVLESEGDLLTEDIAERLETKTTEIVPHLQVLKRNDLVELSGFFRASYQLSSAGSAAAA